MARLGPFEFQRGYQLNFKFSFGFFSSTLLAGLLFCVALPGFAQSTAFLDGALTEDSLTFNNPGGQGAGNQHYCVQAFTVDAAGAYTFEMSSPNTTGTPSDALDTFLRLHQTTFDPSNPGDAIASNDDFTGTLTVLPGPYAGVITSTATGFQGDQPSSRLLNVSLTDGTQYFLVHTAWPSSGNTQVGTAGQPVGQFYTGIAGPGAITLGTGDCSGPQIDADLALSMVVTPASVQAGESISLEATIANDGPAAAEAVSLEVSLPAGVNFVSGGLDQGAGTWSCAEAAGLVTCELTADTLPVDPQAAVLLIELDVALAAAPGNYSLDGEVISENDTDPDLGNNTASVSFELLPFAVTASTAVGQGGITPASQSVASGADASFTLSPATGWSVDSVIGDTCNPINTAGDQWQAANITADCAVEASFLINSYSIGGSVSGLVAAGLQLALNGDQALSVAAGAVSFEFADPLADGSNYDVTVANQPAGQWCEVSNGQGQLDGASVNDVLVSCGDVGINFSLNEIDFGAETVGSSSSIVLTISNPGSTPLSIDGITPPGSPFEIIASGCSPLPVTLEAGESCSLEVRFNNVEPGLQTDELTVSSNANNSPHTIPIRGNGIVAIPVPILSPIGFLLLTLIMLIFGYRSSQRRQRD